MLPRRRTNKLNILSDEKHPNWKGDEVGYLALHQWMQARLGKANHCEFCKKEGLKYEWSRKEKPYKRDLTGWQQLCILCHRRYDLEWKFLGHSWIKQCSRCKDWMTASLSNFRPGGKEKEFQSFCTPCYRGYNRIWKQIKFNRLVAENLCP